MKGPRLFWEKVWGSIRQRAYCERAVPLSKTFKREHPVMELMQDLVALSIKDRRRSSLIMQALSS